MLPETKQYAHQKVCSKFLESAEKDAEGERRMRILGTSTPDLGEDVWEDHHACRPEYHDGVVWE